MEDKVMDTMQDLTLPTDIPWKRMAFSKDMMDLHFNDSLLPHRWNTSLSVFYHMVPKKMTEVRYPGRRILYLKVSSSITGCNFQPFWGPYLAGSIFHDVEEYVRKESLDIDSFQLSMLETINRLLAYYYPCKGAILQLSVFPHFSEKDALKDVSMYPYIQDFEPKKRELYQTVTKSGEVLSGSSNKLNTLKGTTSASSTEESDIQSANVGANASIFGIGVEASYNNEWSTRSNTEVESKRTIATDESTEKKETQSHSTNINQMYQPLLAYHVGSNRAMWVISPRPHTIDSENSLINIAPSQTRETEEGVFIGRQLEGIQDMFLVVNMPEDNKGICVQAVLDTGYDINYVGSPPELEDLINNGKEYTDFNSTNFNINSLAELSGDMIEATAPRPPSVVVMRRTVKSCGIIDGESISPSPIDETKRYNSMSDFSARSGHPVIINEIKTIPKNIPVKTKELFSLDTKQNKVFQSNFRNEFIVQKMLNGNSSMDYKPRTFLETEMFDALLESSLSYSLKNVTDVELIKKEKGAVEELQKLNIYTVGEFYRAKLKNEKLTALQNRLADSLKGLREKLIEKEKKLIK